MQLYATNLGVESVFLHWTYNETPRAGTLVGFAVNVYEHVSRYPERDGKFVIREEFFTTNVNQDEINFVYHLMYLSPGVEYNILVSALTNAGEGPQGRVSFTTLRLGKHVCFAFSLLSSNDFPIAYYYYTRSCYWMIARCLLLNDIKVFAINDIVLLLTVLSQQQLLLL